MNEKDGFIKPRRKIDPFFSCYGDRKLFFYSKEGEKEKILCLYFAIKYSGRLSDDEKAIKWYKKFMYQNDHQSSLQNTHKKRETIFNITLIEGILNWARQVNIFKYLQKTTASITKQL